MVRDEGPPDIHFHKLRNSAATILLIMGVPAKVVQEIPGHRHISITLCTYVHVLPGMHKEAMKKMDDWFGKDDEKTIPKEKKVFNAIEYQRIRMCYPLFSKRIIKR